MQLTSVPRRLSRSFPDRQRLCQQHVPACGARRIPSRALLKLAEGANAKWWQSPEEVFIKLSVEESVKGNDVNLELHPTRLNLRVGNNLVLNGNYEDAGKINIDGSFWDIEEDRDGRAVVITLLKKTMGHDSFEMLFESDYLDKTITHWAYMDFSVTEYNEEVTEKGTIFMGRVFFGLYGNIMPLHVQRFLQLCTGEKGEHKSGELRWYKGTPLHRLIPGNLIEGGDVIEGDGSGRLFEDEIDEAKRMGFLKKGLLGMKDSKFCVNLQPRPESNVPVIGVVHDEPSMAILFRLAEMAGSEEGIPEASVLVADCGVVAEQDLEQMVDEERTRRILAPTENYGSEEEEDDDSWGESLYNTPSEFLDAQTAPPPPPSTLKPPPRRRPIRGPKPSPPPPGPLKPPPRRPVDLRKVK